jgi:hypothetical protein
MEACWAIAGVGQRSTTHLVLLTRWSMTGFMSRLTSCTRADGTSDASKMLSEPRSAM